MRLWSRDAAQVVDGGGGAGSSLTWPRVSSQLRGPTHEDSARVALAQELGVAWMLGRRYEPMPPGGFLASIPSDDEAGAQRARFLADAFSVVWFSYRKNFAPLGPQRTRSDTGWGCMLRSGQMLLCQALLRHFVGDKWTLAENAALMPSFEDYRMVLSWFQDARRPDAPYSIHHMAEIGHELRIPIGEWHGPYTTAHIISMLVNRHCPAGMACTVGTDGMLVEADVRQHFNDGAAAVLVLLPLRLGVELNSIYLPAIQALLALPQSVGFAGGKAGTSLANRIGTSLRVKRLRALQSLYFVGADTEGYFYYLDPHTTQPAVTINMRSCSQDQLRSYHSTALGRLPQTGIDPSVLLGFLMRDEKDYETWRDRVAAISNCPFSISAMTRSAIATPPGGLADVLVGDEDDEDDEDHAGRSAVRSASEGSLVAGTLTGVAPYVPNVNELIAHISHVRRKDLCSLLTTDGPVRGLLVVTSRKVYFEPLQQEPLVQAYGARRFRFTVDLNSIRSVRLEDEAVTADVDCDGEPTESDRSEFVLISSNVEAAASATAPSAASPAERNAPDGPPPYVDRTNDTTVRRLLTSESAVRQVLLRELAACIKRLQVRHALKGPKAVVNDEDEDVPVLIERLELVLRHGLAGTVSLFGERSAPLRPILAAAVPADETEVLQLTCGPAPDDVFFTKCYLRLALTSGTLVSTIRRIVARGRGYRSHAVLAKADQVELLFSILQGLDVLRFSLPIVDISIGQTSGPDAEGVDPEALVRTAAYSFEDVDAQLLEKPRVQVVRIEARHVYALCGPMARLSYNAIIAELGPRQQNVASSSML